MSNRRSKRLQEINSRTLIDDDTQKKRLSKSLQNLEKDNHQEDLNVCLDIPKNFFKFEGIKMLKEKRCRMKKSKISEYFKTRFRKTFEELVEEDLKENSEKPNYTTAKAPLPVRPQRKFCTVCGFLSKYKCITCSMTYCSLKCLDIHKETRCMKWVM